MHSQKHDEIYIHMYVYICDTVVLTVCTVSKCSGTYSLPMFATAVIKSDN